MFNLSGFESEYGYSPDDETIPHMVVLTTLNGMPFKDFLARSYRSALSTIWFVMMSQPQLSADTSTVFKIMNVADAKHPKQVGRITDHPVKTFN